MLYFQVGYNIASSNLSSLPVKQALEIIITVSQKKLFYIPQQSVIRIRHWQFYSYESLGCKSLDIDLQYYTNLPLKVSLGQIELPFLDGARGFQIW